MTDRFPGRRRWLGAVTVASVIAMAGFYELGAATGGNIVNPPANVRTTTRSEAAAGRGYSGVVKQVLPAVVNISSSRVVKEGNPEGAEGLDPFLRQFFGNGNRFNVPRERVQKALGSGVIVSPNGYILTNSHVVDGAKEVNVTLYDKREMKARVVGTDPRTDIAVVKIDGSNFPALMLGDSSKVQVGDIVLAVGDPFGVGQTVTNGIVSALGRGGLGIEEVENFIQTDAPINPGNSGGALVDDEGHLIGINTAIVGNSGGSQGIGFAVPIDMARHDMDEIIAHGKVERGYLGVVPQDLTPALAKAINISQLNGALIGDVTPDSPAARGGLQKGDVVVAINGQAVTSANELRFKIGTMNPNSKVTMRVIRNGQPHDLAVLLGEFPSKEERADLKGGNSENAERGINVETLTPELAQQLKVPASAKGVVVDQVSETSKAADAGLQRGDVIEQVNHQPVNNVQQFNQAMRQSKPDQPVLFLVNREGNTMFLAM
jgi:serine protease Do